MSDRRRIRRSSPDAPQGVVPVLTVFIGLLAVALVAGAGFLGTGSSSSDNDDSDVAKVPDPVVEEQQTVEAPTTAVVRGAVTTGLFVTTTTPITTTTTTTTTTLAGPALAAGETEIVFGPGRTSATFTIRSASPDGIEFEITGVPRGFEVEPTSGHVSEDESVEVRIELTDRERARDGDLRIDGSDGSRATVRLRIDDGDLAIRSIRLDPSPPLCRAATRLVVEVAGGTPGTVTARVDVGGNATRIGLSRSGERGWVSSIPGGAPGATLSGTVTVVGDSGERATDDFSTTIARGPGCADE